MITLASALTTYGKAMLDSPRAKSESGKSHKSEATEITDIMSQVTTLSTENSKIVGENAALKTEKAMIEQQFEACKKASPSRASE